MNPATAQMCAALAQSGLMQLPTRAIPTLNPATFYRYAGGENPKPAHEEFITLERALAKFAKAEEIKETNEKLGEITHLVEAIYKEYIEVREQNTAIINLVNAFMSKGMEEDDKLIK